MTLPRFTVRPRAGVLVRDPYTLRPLPAEGAEVEQSPYWLRRIDDGDVEQVEHVAPPAVEPVGAEE